MYDIIIIGAGPAGMTSAIYAARANKKVLLLEKSMYGGQIIATPLVANYPGFIKIDGTEFANKLFEQVKNLKVDIKFEEVIDIKPGETKQVITRNHQYKGKAVILATGMANRTTGIANANNYLGKGVSYCATCDGPLYKDKTVAVIGSGNSAFQSCLFLANHCKKIYLICRSKQFKGELSTLEEVKKIPNISIIMERHITEFGGNEQIEWITLDDNTKIDLNGVFINIGQIPNTMNFNLLDKDENEFIKALENCHTNIEGIFVAGDCRTKKIRQLTTATSDGTVAALEACDYIKSLSQKNS